MRCGWRCRIRRAGCADGDEVVLGIRPECIAEENRRFGDDPRNSLVLQAPVEMTEPTGAETIVLLRLGGEQVFGRIAPDVSPAVGEPWRFAVDTAQDLSVRPDDRGTP